MPPPTDSKHCSFDQIAEYLTSCTVLHLRPSQIFERPSLTNAIAYIDSNRMVRALTAGIAQLFKRREYIDRINVFPVPDGDTGTNMAFSFKIIHKAIGQTQGLPIKEMMTRVAHASLDGSRGNSGAIMAQYFHGFSESLGDKARMTAREFASASSAGARVAWTAMSEPVAGALPTVLEDFSAGLQRKAQQGVDDICKVFEHGLESARKSLAGTPDQLPVLKRAGVVDAGGQGFVDLLEGIWGYIRSGGKPVSLPVMDELLLTAGTTMEIDAGAHRFCTECVIHGDALEREVIMEQLQQLDCSSLMVAGGRKRVRVHLHVNNPGEVFLASEKFGEIHQQKADDMRRQHGLMSHTGKVAVVTDSGADIPFEEQERLAIHMVPVRLNFGAREYIDHVSLQSADLYRMLVECDELPKTSQPPVGDFARQYELLTSHGYDVMSVGLSKALSGTTQAARTAAQNVTDGQVRVLDSQSASTGQGLLAIIAAEAAQQGMSLDEIEALLLESRKLTRTMAIPADLGYIVRGGRVPAWLKVLADFLHIKPILVEKAGNFSLAGFATGTGAKPSALGKAALRRMKKNVSYRLLISHGANPEGARVLRRYILSRHSAVHSCHITEAGPALGVHLGPGGLVVGFLPQSSEGHCSG